MQSAIHILCMQTTFAVLNKPIPAVVYEIANLGVTKSRIPVAPYGRPGTTDLSDSVIEPVQEADVFLLQGHGAVAVSQGDIYDAYLSSCLYRRISSVILQCTLCRTGRRTILLPTRRITENGSNPSQNQIPITNNRLHRRRRICNEENYQPAR